MAPKIKVEIAQLDLAEQVLERQKAHMDGAGRFVQANCRASGAFTGVLGLLEGHYSRAYDAGTTGMSNGSTIAQTCATLTNGTRKEFIARDRAAYEAMAKKGTNLPPYEAPTGGTVRSGVPVGPVSAKPAPGVPLLDQMKSWKDFVEQATHVTKPGWQNPKELWRVQQGNFDSTQRTDPKYWIQRGLDKQVNALRKKLDGMSPTERGNYLRNRQRSAYADGQDWARRHGLDNDSASPSPASGAVTSPDAGRIDTLGKAVTAPSALVSEGKDIWDAKDRLLGAIDQTRQVDDAVNGPRNDDGITWAKNHKGGTW